MKGFVEGNISLSIKMSETETEVEELTLKINQSIKSRKISQITQVKMLILTQYIAKHEFKPLRRFLNLDDLLDGAKK